MSEDRRKEQRDDLIRRADERYRSFPDFATWASRRIDVAPWASSLTECEAERQLASRESLQRALDFALRAAAIDTGAIEGLYQVDRGFTFSVAAQATTWESDLADKGPHVRRLFEAQLAGLELVVDAVTTRALISEAWVRRLHEVLCAGQDTYRVRTAEVEIDRIAVDATSPEFRPVRDGSASVKVSVRSSEPARLVDWKYQVVVARKTDAFYALQVEQVGVPDNPGGPLRIRFDLVHPSLKTAFHAQLEPWVRMQTSELLQESGRRIEAAALRSARR